MKRVKRGVLAVVLSIPFVSVALAEQSPADAAAAQLEPVHPHARWQGDDERQVWQYEYTPRRWSAPPPSPPVTNPNPPQQWYSEPQRREQPQTPYPSQNWPPPPAGPYWNTPPSYQYWEPGYRSRDWEPAYPPQIWYQPPR